MKSLARGVGPDTVVLISGAGGGIGRACARRFARAGARLVLIDGQAGGLAAAVAEVSALVPTENRQVDVRDQGALAELVHAVEQRHGAIDIAIHCAGILHTGLSWQVPAHDYREQMEVNYHGTVNLNLALLPGMLARGRGHLVNLASINALYALPEFGAYAASKAAVLSFSQALRDELALQHSAVRVSVVCPATVRTPMVETLVDRPAIYGRLPWLAPERVAGAIWHGIRRNRFLILVDWQSRGLWWLTRLAPGLAGRVMRRLSVGTSERLNV